MAIAIGLLVCTIAQPTTVERWTPCGGSTRPGHKSPWFEARRALDVYEAPDGYCCGWWQTLPSRSQLENQLFSAMCVR